MAVRGVALTGLPSQLERQLLTIEILVHLSGFMDLGVHFYGPRCPFLWT